MLNLITTLSLAAPLRDLVTSLPGFSSWPFQLYSGYLTVPGPFEQNEYDSLEIHYQFHTSQNDAKKDPLVTWHQGGPGSSSTNLGLYTEMGYFQIDDQGAHTNEYAWNRVANMLYLESPAGSGSRNGFSTCIKGGAPVGCRWDDQSQAEAYAHTLAAFHKAFPEFASHDLYLTGESYFGQYGPNIASFIVNNAPFNTSLNLKGIAAGNACWGTGCNGPNSEQNDVDMYYGKGLVSKKLYTEIYQTCDFPAISHDCDKLLDKASDEMGPHNVYFIYDNCPRGLAEAEALLRDSGKSWRWLKNALRTELATNGQVTPLSDLVATASARRLLGDAANKTGGFDWSCGAESATVNWITSAAVRRALNLMAPGRSSFSYSHGGPPSITIWPSLITKMRVLIYNGDADDCVPYKGNEEWITQLEGQGLLTETKPWAPWYGSQGSRAPAGYVVTYEVPAAPQFDFAFVTIRVSGHMVPTFQPGPSYDFFERFLSKSPY